MKDLLGKDQAIHNSHLNEGKGEVMASRRHGVACVDISLFVRLILSSFMCCRLKRSRIISLLSFHLISFSCDFHCIESGVVNNGVIEMGRRSVEIGGTSLGNGRCINQSWYRL